MELLSLETIQSMIDEYGYWAIFVGISLENMGIPVPGETITILGGFLSGTEELSYPMVLVSAISGAVIGDNIGYWIGRQGGWTLLLKVGNFFKIKESQLEEARLKFSKNAAKAVFFGRFITLLRVFAGPLAGITEMPYGKFFLCNLAGATLWGFVTISLSFMLGKLVPLETLIQGSMQLGLVLVLGILAWLAFRYFWKSLKKNPT